MFGPNVPDDSRLIYFMVVKKIAVCVTSDNKSLCRGKNVPLGKLVINFNLPRRFNNTLCTTGQLWLEQEEPIGEIAFCVCVLTNIPQRAYEDAWSPVIWQANGPCKYELPLVGTNIQYSIE